MGRRKQPNSKPSTDPATGIEYVGPNFSRPTVPHVMSFQSIVTGVSHAYRNPDEAVKHSKSNALAMRKDCAIMECLEARQRSTALLNWHLEPEDPKSQYQKQLVEDLTKIIKEIPRFTEYRRNLMEAIWYGREGIQHVYAPCYRTGKRRIVMKEWFPINGDKLVFRYDDGSGEYTPGQVGIKVHTGWNAGEDRVIEPTVEGLVYFLEPWERQLLAIHKHFIEDAAFEDTFSAGALHGVGIRDRIYWTWFQKQEVLAQLMEFIQRAGQGVWVYYYPYGNPEAHDQMLEVAKNQTASNVLLIPRMPGDPAMDAFGVDRIEPNPSGAQALKEIVHEFFGHQIKRYILGQVLSTESEATGLGSGVADLHQLSLQQIVHYDAQNLEETLTTDLVEVLKEHNFPLARNVKIRFKIDTESAEVEKKLQAALQAWEMGAKLKEQDIMDLIGFSMPTDDDRFLQNPQIKQQDRLWEDHQAAIESGNAEADAMPDDPQAMFGPIADAEPPAASPPEEMTGQQYSKHRSGQGQGMLFGDDESHGGEWDEEKHPRGQPENKGEFAPRGGGTTTAEPPQAEPKPENQPAARQVDAEPTEGDEAEGSPTEEKPSKLSPDEQEKLVKEHVSLARKMAWKYKGHHDLDDVESEAMFGLIKAAKKFDPDAGSPFKAYASTAIKQQIFGYFRGLNADKRNPDGGVGSLDVTDKEGDRLSDPVDYREAVPGKEDDSDEGRTPFDSNTLRLLHKHLASLDDRSRDIVTRNLIGKDGVKESMQQIGDAMGISKQRVGQIFKAAAKTLADAVKHDLAEPKKYRKQFAKDTRGWMRRAG